MKLYASGEDYLEAILVLQKKLDMVRSVDVARHMEVSKPSVFLLARDKNALRFTSKDLLCGLLIGVMNAVSNLFMLKCLDVLSVNSVMLSVPASNMLIAALIGQFFFKEKLNIHTWIALVLTVISLILTNWLRKNDTQTVQKLRRCRQRIGISDICKSG